MTRFEFWQRWLVVFSLLIVIFGTSMALLSRTALFGMVDDLVNPVFWDSKTVTTETDDFQGWIYGVLGATMAGWGVFLAFIAHIPFKRKERWAWNCLALGLLTWYVLDTAISLSYGVLFNAAFNTVLMIPVLLPLVFTRREFASSA